MICLKHLVLILIQWWFWRALNLNFHTWNKSCSPDCWRVSSLFSAFRNVERKSMAKSYRPICLLSVVSKILGKILNNRLVDHLEKYDLSLFQRLILWQLNLIELLGLLISLGLIELLYLIYSKLLKGFGTPVFFTNSILMKFQVGFWPCFVFS